MQIFWQLRQSDSQIRERKSGSVLSARKELGLRPFFPYAKPFTYIAGLIISSLLRIILSRSGLGAIMTQGRK